MSGIVLSIVRLAVGPITTRDLALEMLVARVLDRKTRSCSADGQADRGGASDAEGRTGP
jgi:hypothetical protein